MGAIARVRTFIAHTLARASDVEAECNNFVAGINARIDKDGSLHFAGTDPFTLEYSDPYVEFIDTQTTGETWRIHATVDTTAFLDIDVYDSGWENRLRIPFDHANDRWEVIGVVTARNFVPRGTSPYVLWEGTEPSAEFYRIREDAGMFQVQWYNSVTPAYEDLMYFDTTDGVHIIPDVYLDVIRPHTGVGPVEVTGALTVSAHLTVEGPLVLTGTPPISTPKVLGIENMNMDKVDTLTLTNTQLITTYAITNDIDGGSDLHVAAVPISNVLAHDCKIFHLCVTGQTLGTTDGEFVEVTPVVNNAGLWHALIKIWNYHAADSGRSLVIEVYQWVGEPDDHTEEEI